MKECELLPALLLITSLFVTLSLPLRAATEQGSDLLFTPQRVKRLKRDRERQTQRWMNFENRVKTVPDSPERGFELALYFLITGDDSVSAQVRTWRDTHTCDRRQTALIAAVLDDGVLPEPAATCPPSKAGKLSAMRDRLFRDMVLGKAQFDGEAFRSQLHNTPFTDGAEIYAGAEILAALPREQRYSIRQDDAHFFNALPTMFLLSLKPRELDHPDSFVHLAALALVASDPNGDSAQFVQGWAIEDRQIIGEGPGVAYELLWADPYLPGVGYQNMEPWWYDEEASRLQARTDWSLDACSVRISPGNASADACPDDWQRKRMEFGRLQLMPVLESCVQVPERPNNASIILSKLSPGARLKTPETGRSSTIHADNAGMWRVPSNVAGKVCIAK